MSEGKKNIDSVFDDKIKHSLYNYTSADFSSELLKRVQLQKEFAKEDVKTDRLVKFVLMGLVTFLTVFAVSLSFILYANDDRTNVSYADSTVDKFTNFIQYISTIITETLGFTFNFQTGLIILLVMICVFLFSFADKVIFKKIKNNN